MATWLVIVGAIFQLVLVLIQSAMAKDSEVKAIKNAMSKEIVDAVSSGDVSRINNVINGVRK